MRSDSFPDLQDGHGEAVTAAVAADSTARRTRAAKTVHTEDAESVRLGPLDRFPAEMAELSLTEVQVLHSRLSRELDWEHCFDPEGPHPVTVDRHQELTAELDTRCTDLPRPGASA